MKKVIVAMFCVAAAGWAQDHAEFHAAMKATGTAFEALQKMEPKTGQAAVSAAESLGAVYERMIGFWRQEHLADAVKISVDGKAAATQLASAAYAGNNQQAAVAFKALGATCRACHTKYRVKRPDGSTTFAPLYLERKRQ